MNEQLQLVTTSQQMQQVVAQLRSQQQRIGLVPTMGALHAGHLSLVEAASQLCDCVIVTIFVNPTQFAPNEDLEKYPRMLEEDLDQLRALNVDLVFAPGEEEIYPDELTATVEPPAIAQPWEGVHRPHHFAGVVTVVDRLFRIIPADVAFFGQKDYQQAMVIQQLVRDTDIPIDVQVCPIVRDQDGLALSSRNRYLDTPQRKQATTISACLAWAQDMVEQGEYSTRILVDSIRQQLREKGIHQVDYVAIVDPTTLAELSCIEGPSMLLMAAHVGDVRLIDNCCLTP